MIMPFLPQEFIRKKRDGLTVSRKEIEEFVHGIVTGYVTEAHMAAFAMAVFFSGMTIEECASLTIEMAHSGQTFAWDLHGPVLDKHSTGGVGDTTSLVLAPLIAACGGYVPMVSGRGLGHTGGTADKMEAIPGYKLEPDTALFRQVVETIGCAIIGQTSDIAPADRRLYGVRDVTATAESIPLITASILSKKIAEGIDGLVMDIKYGNGAFMPKREKAQQLAHSLKTVAATVHLPIDAILTDMNQPLASCAGNALEVLYALDFMTGTQKEVPFYTIVRDLATSALLLGKLAPDVDQAHKKIAQALDSGRVLEIFERMVHALGGPPSHKLYDLEKAPLCIPVYGEKTGIISAIDVRGIGNGVISLGGGRTVPYGLIDPAVGFTCLARLGESIQAGQSLLGQVHARTKEQGEGAKKALLLAYVVED